MSAVFEAKVWLFLDASPGCSRTVGSSCGFEGSRGSGESTGRLGVVVVVVMGVVVGDEAFALEMW